MTRHKDPIEKPVEDLTVGLFKMFGAIWLALFALGLVCTGVAIWAIIAVVNHFT